jgi:hypothetical protein
MKKRTIALGVDDFKKVVEGNHYLVDKSLFIKEIIEDGAEIILLPRPRSWGKTLNMTMLKYFFQKSEQSNRHLFKGLVVEQNEELMEHQGKYPVIFLTLKDVKKLDWDFCYDMLQDVITKEYERNKYLLESNILTESENIEFKAILSKVAKQPVYERALLALSSMLHRYHGTQVIILIDEYDLPIISGFEHGYYQEIIGFMQTFLGSAFKGNPHLKKGVLTGILRVSKESIFSGLNNISVCTLLDESYSPYFGFLESEVQAMLAYYGPHENDAQMKIWYNNYWAGNAQSVYNPWSVLSYLNKNRSLLPHWMNSANNTLIRTIIENAPSDFKEDIEQLMLGKTIEKERTDFVTFNSIYTSTDIAFNFSLLTGYLSFNKRRATEFGEAFELVIPNKEVMYFYKNSVKEWIQETLSFATYQTMLKELVSGDIDSFKQAFEISVERALSSFDVDHNEPEKFYHMFVLGMLVCLQESHEVKSNRESGSGRYDVMLIPKDLTKIGIIIEFKKAKHATDVAFEAATQDALEQIKNKNYKAELESRGITQIINLAIVFAHKRALVSAQS